MTQIRDLTVAQNLLLPDEPVTRWGGVRRREAERRVAEHLESLGLGYIDPRLRIGKNVATARVGELPEDEIVRMIIGRPLILRCRCSTGSGGLG